MDMDRLEQRLIEICKAYLTERSSNNKHLKIDEDLDNSLVTINCFEDTECHEHQIHPKILGSVTIIKGKDYIFNKSLDETFEGYITEKINYLKELHLI